MLINNKVAFRTFLQNLNNVCFITILKGIKGMANKSVFQINKFKNYEMKVL